MTVDGAADTPDDQPLREALKTVREILVGVGELFFDIRMDYTDPRTECREGIAGCAHAVKIIDAAMGVATASAPESSSEAAHREDAGAR